ncbi:hypothetical protein ACFVU2_02135 [Leifsonia sp. NPDC058194]|uniref:hypothetical protein n=1 Tax=Leifsonia sp. NPDC058194 TaxID=3346374 RepID=UPI0036DE39F9
MDADVLLDRTGFSVRRGTQAGLTRRQLDGRRLQRPFRGLRTEGQDLDDHATRCRAYAALDRHGHAFSHHSAAVLHGFPLKHGPAQPIHVSVFAPRKPPQMAGVVGHELRAAGHRVVEVDGLRVVAAEDTWAQLSSTLPLTDLVVIGDWLITGDEPYSGAPSRWERSDLERAVRHHGRRPGIRVLRQALDAVRYGSLSPQESRLRLELTAAGLPQPALNHRVTHEGRRVAMVDLAYPDRRLAIEYLGDHHRTDQDAYREDIHRRERLIGAGWEVVFLTAADLSGPVPRAILTVRRAYARSIPE